MTGTRESKYEQCGAFGHQMHEVDTTWKPTFGNPLTLRCALCNTERRIQLHNDGRIMTSNYVHPDDYHWYPKGERPARADFRAAMYEKSKYAQEVIATAQDQLAARREKKGKTA